jgi:hypothetical protein
MGSNFPLRLPDDLRDAASRQAEANGVSSNQLIATAVAAQVGAQAEAARYFQIRGRRGSLARARAILARAGTQTVPDAGDRIEAA